MEKLSIAVSGVNGFVGKHLARELNNNDIRVIGLGMEPLVNPEIKDIVDEYHSVDLSSEWPNTSEVGGIIHLAGLAAVGPSFDNPQKYINLNSSMITNLCEHYIDSDISPRIVLVSSGAIYDPSQPMPINEDSEIGYSSPYAVSKVLNENQATYYRGRGLDIVTARPFNHIGPGQIQGFILPDLLQGVNTAKVNSSPLLVGNLDTRRDYTDVRDVARAYRLLATTRNLGNTVYNICSGRSLSGNDILNSLLDKTKTKDLKTEVDKTKIRPNDTTEIYGDSSRLRGDTGWKPEININKTIEDFIESES